MADLYTKNGKPLIVEGDDIFNSSGRQVGRRRGSVVYGPDGRYAGTIEGDMIVYHPSNSGMTGPSFSPRSIVGTTEASRAGSATSGDEPFQS